MIKANYITVNEFAEYNPELDLSGYSATTISGMIMRASAYMDNYLQYSLSVENIVDEVSDAVVSPQGDLIVNVMKYPLISVSSVGIKVGSNTIYLQLTDGNGLSRLQIPVRKDCFVFPYIDIAWTGTFSVTSFLNMRQYSTYVTTNYRAGYETIPPDLKDVCNLLAKDIFIRQSNPMGMSAMQQGGIRMQFKEIGNEKGKSDLKLQAEAILDSYKRVVGI